MVARAWGPRNGGSPASISYRRRRRGCTRRSAPSSSRSPLACSGLMYSGVPSAKPRSRHRTPAAARGGTTRAPWRSRSRRRARGRRLEQDVLRLDVAMDDAVAVGVVERAATASRAIRSASSIGSGPSRASRSRRLSSRRGMNEETQSGPIRRDAIARVDERHEVRMRQPRRDPDLAEKPLRRRADAATGVQDLDRDRAAVLPVLGAVDDRGAPRPTSSSTAIAIGDEAAKQSRLRGVRSHLGKIHSPTGARRAAGPRGAVLSEPARSASGIVHRRPRSRCRRRPGRFPTAAGQLPARFPAR